MRWTQQDIKFLKDMYSEAPAFEFAQILKIPTAEVRAKAKLLGLKSWKDPRSPWTAHQKERLARLYPKYTNAAIAKKLGKTEDAVNEMAYRLGLKKPHELRSRTMKRVMRRQRRSSKPSQRKPEQG